MSANTNISIEEILENRKYLIKQAVQIEYFNPTHSGVCKSLANQLADYSELETSYNDIHELGIAKEDILSAFIALMDRIRESAVHERIRNRLSKSKSKKIKKTEKQPKIDDSTLFQLSGFALQLGAQKNETVSIDQALKFLLEHAVKTIRFS